MSARSSGLVAAAALPIPSSSSSAAAITTGGDVPRPPPRRRAASVAGQQQTRLEFGNGHTPRRSLATVVSSKCRLLNIIGLSVLHQFLIKVFEESGSPRSFIKFYGVPLMNSFIHINNIVHKGTNFPKRKPRLP